MTTSTQTARQRARTRVPPHNLEAEASLLGAMLLSRNAVANAIEAVQAEHFYRPLHRQVFEAMWDLHRRGEAVDHVTVAEELRRRGELEQIGGLSFLADLASVVPATTNAPHYARVVREAHLLRELIRAGTQAIELGFEPPGEVPEILDRAEALFYALSRDHSSPRFAVMSELMHRAFDAIERRSEAGGPATGLSSGFDELDEFTTGLHPGNLILIAARPGMGKSSFALNVAAHASLRVGAGVAVFSLEMSADEVAERLLSAEARVDASRVRKGRLHDADWPKITKAASALADAPLFVDESPTLGLIEMRAKCRRIASRHPLGLVVLDYVQLMQARDARHENRATLLGEISRGLKVLARELAVPVLACAQLNRSPEARNDKRPLLGDLRDSGALEMDADVVAFLFRPGYYERERDSGATELILAKNRQGRTGCIDLVFEERFTTFTGGHVI